MPQRLKDVDARDKPGHDVDLNLIVRAWIASSQVLRAMTMGHPHTIYCPPLIDSVEPVMAPASSAARNTTARAISSGSPRRLTGISGRMLFSSTSFGTACTISVLI